MRIKVQFNGITAIGLLALSVVCMGMAACGKDDEPSGPKSIAFSGIESRATPLPDGQFGVLAYYTGTDSWSVASATATPGLMYNQMVQKTGTSFTYIPLRYWPGLPNEKITFYAYSPYNGSGITLSGSTQTGAPWVDYTVAAAPAAQLDLLNAVLTDKTDTATPAVLPFVHALTQVKFSAKVTADDSQFTATLTGCKISGINNQGRLSLGGSWSNLAGNATYTILDSTIDPDGIDIPYNATSPNVALGKLFMIPQSVTAGQIEISYTIDSPFENAPIERTDIFPLTAEVWARNKVINYLFTVKLTGVGFTLQVEDWTDIPDPNSGTSLE